MKCSLILPFMAVLFSAGCDFHRESEAGLTPAASSNQALMRVLDALDRRDPGAVLSLVDGGPKVRDFFASIVESFEAADAFKRKFSDTYGADAWDAFQAPLPTGQKRPDMKLAMPDLARIRRDSAEWEANDGNGGVFDLLPQISLPFKKTQGGWVIDGSKVFPDEETLAGITETQRKLAGFIRSYMKAIGHPSIGPEDIDYQMGKDLLIFLMGGEFETDGEPAIPDRFRIGEI